MHVRARIAGTVVCIAAASASPSLAEAAGWPMTLPSAGFCVPAPADATFVPRLVKSLGVTGGTTPPLALLDTGVDPSIGELAGRVLPGVDALTGAPVSDDPDGHGTEAAGLAAAAGPAVVGVSPTTAILPVRIYDANRATSADAVAKGIVAAAARSAKAIVIAGSGPLAGATDDDLHKVQTAIGDAFASGAIVVAGSGDDGNATQTLPGGLPHVLTAGAATANSARSAQTNFNPWLDVLVPAENVISPLPAALCEYGYGAVTGSSYAAPSLGAAVVLVMGKRPGLTTQQYFELMRRAGADLGAIGRDDDTGFGLLDVSAALSAALPAKDTSPEVDDDIYWVRGRYAKAHPKLLTLRKSRFKAQGSVSSTKDPADVYPISLRKGDRVVVSVKAADPSALLELAIFDPQAGGFDVTDGEPEFIDVGTGGLLNDPQVELTAKRSGTYYIAINAPDPIDADDPTAVPAEIEPYTLSAYKQHKKAKKTSKKR